MHLKLCSIFLLLSFFVLMMVAATGYPQTVVINEIMSLNGSTIVDEDGDYEDWIELYNYGTDPVGLEGYGISDNDDSPFKWIFPDVTIEAGQYLLIWASGKDRRAGQGELANGLMRDVYTGIPGWAVPDLTNHPDFPDNPAFSGIVHDLFEAPMNVDDHYGQRIHGWIKAPATGQYVFWISSDDHSELLLSTSDSPDDLVLIAHVPGWNTPREWNKYPEQQSAPVDLQEGEYYYVLALMKEHEGGDNLAVGWQLPDGALERPVSGQHLFRNNAELHTNFSISSAGEDILLTNPSGTTVDELAPVALPTDVSYGRSPDGSGSQFFFDEPTPGESNTSQTFTELMEPPAFSASGGFFTSGFNLSITHSDPDATIIYSLDGSNPDIENLSGKPYHYKNSYPQYTWNQFGPLLTNTYQSYIYAASIEIADRSGEPDKLTHISSTWHYTPGYFPVSPVSKGSVVKAVAVKDGAIPSRPVSNTYLIFPEGRDKYDLPVVSIGLQEDHFYDYEKGIFVAGIDFDDWRTANPSGSTNGGTPANYWRRGYEWEYPGSIEVFPSGADVAALRQAFGVRIHGGWSRSFPNKSLRLYARNIYGEEHFNYRFFPDDPSNNFKRLMLRNSGNDADVTMLRDAAIHKIVAGLKFDVQDYQPVVLFVNGEYWGIHNFRERYDKHYLARVYGVDPENLDILENEASAKQGDPGHYDDMCFYLESNNMSQPEHYNHIKTRMDIENFTDYYIAEIFAGNTDWPGNNIDFWRLRTTEYIPGAALGHDGRWRWMMFDVDFGFGLFGGSPAHNTLAFAAEPNGPSWPNPPWSTFVFRRLLTNPEFELQFINRFADLVNTTFLSSRMVEIINNMKQEIAPEMPAHIHRWKAPPTINAWNNNVNVMINFAEQRPAYQRQHIRQFFNISENITVTLDVDDAEQGFVRINSINITPETHGVADDPYPWTGIYFHGIPFEVEAIAQPGFEFSHWEGSVSGSDALISIIPENDINLTAHFTEIELPDTEIIHYWHFNDLPTGILTSVPTDYSLPGIDTGVITYPGTGDGYMDRRTHSTDDPVSDLNLLMGQQPDQGAVLRVRNPSDTRELFVEASSFAYENIQVVFATTRTSNGATQQEFFYSTDAGSSWNLIEPAYTIPQLPVWALKVFDLSEITEVDNNPELRFRALLGGESASGNAGNNRFDNFSVHGELLQPALLTVDPDTAPQGDVVDLVITGENTLWTAHDPDVFMIYTSAPPVIYEAFDVTVSGNTMLTAAFEIPSDAPVGLYNIHVDNLIMMDAVTVTFAPGINEHQVSPRVYPNPATELLWVETGIPSKLKFYNLNGRLVLEIITDGECEAVSLKGMERGVYLIEMITDRDKRVTRLVIR